jgi:hypothetical protein
MLESLAKQLALGYWLVGWRAALCWEHALEGRLQKLVENGLNPHVPAV